VTSVQALVDATRFLAVSDCADIATERWRKADDLDDGDQARSGAHAAARFQLCLEHYGATSAQQMVDRAQWFLLGTTCTGYAGSESAGPGGLPADAGPIEDPGQSLARMCASEPQLCANAGIEP
jgi:hypothetical protein